jgi:hypothetical protein
MGKKSAYYEAAEDLYVVESFTLEAIAARLGPDGPSVTSLSNWKQEGEWDRLRSELAAAQAGIKRDSLRLREKLIKNALEAGKPQAVYAFCTLEATLARINNKGSQAGTPAPLGTPASLGPLGTPGPLSEAVRRIKTPQEAVSVLNEVLEVKLNAMLTQPELLTLAGIKDIKQCLELMENLKTKYAPDERTGQTPGLSDEAAAVIRQQILGVQ